jgi:hypothetical protein
MMRDPLSWRDGGKQGRFRESWLYFGFVRAFVRTSARSRKRRTSNDADALRLFAR